MVSADVSVFLAISVSQRSLVRPHCDFPWA